MTRRGLIRRLLLVFAVRSSVPWRRAGRPEAEAAQPAVQSGKVRAPALSPAELDDLVAFGEVVVGSAPLSPAERGFLIDHIQYRVPRADGYYLSAYRTTVRLLRQLGGVRFASLDIEKRRALVTRHRLDSPLVSAGREPRRVSGGRADGADASPRRPHRRILRLSGWLGGGRCLPG